MAEKPKKDQPGDRDAPLSPDEKVEEGSMESFPASDPPSYNPGSAGAPESSEDEKKKKKK